MAKRPLPTPEELRQLLRYDPQTGELFWRPRPHLSARATMWCTRFTDKPAGWLKDGYLNITLKGQKLRAHRVAWAIHYGEWPRYQIDHINGVRNDNRITNLRDVPAAINCQNQRMSRRNKSGYACVFKVLHRWRAEVRHNGKLYRLGSFDSPEKANEVVKAKHAELGFTERHGRSG